MNILALDTRTLSYVNMAVSAVLSLTMIFIWQTRKTYPGFYLWTVAYLAAVLGYFLLGLRGHIPDLFSVSAAYTLIYLQYMLLFEGVCSFRGRPGRWYLHGALGIFLFFALVFFTYFLPYANLRIILISLAQAGISGQCAFVILRGVPHEMRSAYWFTGGTFVSYCVVMLARTVYLISKPENYDLFSPDLFQSVSFLAILLLSIAWTLGFVTLNSERLEQELKQAQIELKLMAETDYLTGIYNPRHFFEIGRIEIARARRFDKQTAVLMFDIDHFKQINDTYGHPEGDIVLISVVAACQRCLREVDTFCRLGGDEFGLLMPETDLEEALLVAERLRMVVESMVIMSEERAICITASFGVAVIEADEYGLEPALKRADDALYEAKRYGRNQVITLAL